MLQYTEVVVNKNGKALHRSNPLGSIQPDIRSPAFITAGCSAGRISSTSLLRMLHWTENAHFIEPTGQWS